MMYEMLMLKANVNNAPLNRREARLIYSSHKCFQGHGAGQITQMDAHSPRG